MFLDQKLLYRARKESLDRRVRTAKTTGLPEEQAGNLRRILSRRVAAFRRAVYEKPCQDGADTSQIQGWGSGYQGLPPTV